MTADSPRLIDAARKAARSIAANHPRSLRRRIGPERHQFFRFARGSAEEVDEH